VKLCSWIGHRWGRYLGNHNGAYGSWQQYTTCQRCGKVKTDGVWFGPLYTERCSSNGGH
jgi:hypothetical protein